MAPRCQAQIVIEDDESDEHFVLSNDEWREFFRTHGVLAASKALKIHLRLAYWGVNAAF